MEPPAKMPRLQREGNQRPGRPASPMEPEAAALGSGGFLEGDASATEGQTNVNFQEPLKMPVRSATFTRQFEHSINTNIKRGFYRKDDTDLTCFHTVPYHLQRASLTPEDVLWIEGAAYAAKLDSVSCKVINVEATETIVTGSDNNPKLRSKKYPKASIQVCWTERGFSTDYKSTYYNGNETDYVNNMHMTDPNPNQVHGDYGKKSGKLPLFSVKTSDDIGWATQETSPFFEMKKAMAHDLYQSRKYNVTAESIARKLDKATADDQLEHSDLPLFDPEMQFVKTMPIEEFIGKSYGVKTKHNAWSFVNKVASWTRDGLIGAYYHNTNPQDLQCRGEYVAFPMYTDPDFCDVAQGVAWNDVRNPPEGDARQKDAGLPYNGYRFPMNVTTNGSWHTNVFNLGNYVEEGPICGWPELLIHPNMEDDAQGPVEREFKLIMEYTSKISYIPLMVPSKISIPREIIPAGYRVEGGTTTVPSTHSHMIQKIMSMNFGIWPIAVVGRYLPRSNIISGLKNIRGCPLAVNPSAVTLHNQGSEFYRDQLRRVRHIYGSTENVPQIL